MPSEAVAKKLPRKPSPICPTPPMGDGPQASKLANPVAAIGSPDLARQAKPVEWYNIVTNGEMNLFMPPFSGSLSDRQRWDVIAYVFTLGSSSQAVQQGESIYTEQCAACHGASGRGDGAKRCTIRHVEFERTADFIHRA